MLDQEIHVIGDDDMVLLFGILGIEGTIIENQAQFMKEFHNIIRNKSIGFIIIALDLPNDIVDYIIDFKLNNRRPLVFYLPDIFKPNIESQNIFSKKISESLGRFMT